MENEELILVEVKPKYALEFEENLIKFQSAIDYYFRNGMNFEVWSESKLFT